MFFKYLYNIKKINIKKIYSNYNYLYNLIFKE